MVKPQIIAKLIKDKAVGAIIGFTDTINWTTESVANLKGEEGIKIEWGDGSHPTIKLEEKPLGIKFVGTDGSNAIIGNTKKYVTVSFDSMSDSNVQATIVKNGADSVSIKLGVYYL